METTRKNKYKICFFVPFYPKIKGGAEYQSRIIADELAKLGHEIVYISYGHKYYQIEHLDDYKVYTLHIRKGFVERITLYRSTMTNVKEIIAIESPDFVYQRILNTFSFRLSKSLKKMAIPFILHIADNYSITFSNSLHGYLKRTLFNEIMHCEPILICQTKFQKSLLTSYGHPPNVLISNMHPEISKYDIVDKKMNQIVWVGNVRPVKQVEVFIRLAQESKELDYDFHIIGNVPDTVYGNAIIKSMESIKRLIYHGQKDNDFINKLLTESTLLVNTSKSEGFSNTFIQSWLCGTPVLSLNSDPDGVISKYDIGYNCEGDVEALLPKLKYLTQASDYNEMCARCEKTAQDLFLPRKNIDKFVGLLNDTR